jgi:hypothetical protein
MIPSSLSSKGGGAYSFVLVHFTSGGIQKMVKPFFEYHLLKVTEQLL